MYHVHNKVKLKKMPQKSITSFLMNKRQADIKSNSDASSSKKANLEEISEKPVTATLKTVLKWQRELNVDLETIMGPGDSSTVTKMACKTCKMFAPADSTSKKKLLNLVAKWPGSCHDTFIFRTSELADHPERTHRGFDIDGVLLGDSGYACGKYLVTPYLNPVNQSQINYNQAHTRTRAVVERYFGWWKRRFTVLHNEIRIGLERLRTYTVNMSLNSASERLVHKALGEISH